jgi:metallo-beta-lactamase family protein
MAVSASEIYAAHRSDLNFDWDEHAAVFTTARTRFVRSVRHSKALHEIRSKAIIISASGMGTGGRVVHHLARRVGGRRNTVLFAGHQVAGTRGRKLVDGAKTIRMHGKDHPVRCRVEHVDSFSAHGDQRELLRWVGSLATKPRRTFVVHGEPAASAAFADKLVEQYGHAVELPDLGSVYTLD